MVRKTSTPSRKPSNTRNTMRFPFVQLELVRIDTKESMLSDETGVVGKDSAMENLMGLTEEVTPGMIRERLGDRQHLFYTMNIKAPSKKIAEMKAKAFVRSRNPFEPSRVGVTNSEKIEDGTLRNTYNVAVGISK